MATAEVQNQPSEAPGLPDYLLDPNAVLQDSSANWRYGRAPDYSNTRKVYNESTFFNAPWKVAVVRVFCSPRSIPHFRLTIPHPQSLLTFPLSQNQKP